jgi:hypothetical protein
LSAFCDIATSAIPNVTQRPWLTTLGADLDRLSPQARLGTRLRVRGLTKTNPLRV